MAIEKDAIEEYVAVQWATNWRNDIKHVVKGHLVSRTDIFELYSKTGVEDVRVYMGIDEAGLQKLMLVGVDVNGKDLIDSAKGYYIYDFTAPCPNTCDTSSILYNLKITK